VSNSDRALKKIFGISRNKRSSASSGNYASRATICTATSNDSSNFSRVIDSAQEITGCSSKSNPIRLSFTESCIGAKLIADMKVDLHPQIVEKNGKKESVLLPYAEYVALREWIEDMEDLLELREAKRAEGHLAGRPLEEVAKELRL